MEVYKAVFDGVLRIHPADAEADSALTENLREGVTDDLVPVCSMGDPDTLYATAYRFDGDIPGGVVMVRGDEDAERFAVVAETKSCLRRNRGTLQPHRVRSALRRGHFRG